MHYAQDLSKCLLHSGACYIAPMESANARLKAARERAGFPSAAAAARSLGISAGTYAGHENGYRGFPAARAPAYARKFKVSEEWLLYGKGDARPDGISEDELATIIADAQAQLPTNLPFGEWPKAVASAVKLRIDMLLRDRANAGSEGRQA